MHPPVIHVSVHLSIHPSICPSRYLQTHLLFPQSACLFGCLHLAACLYIWLSVCFLICVSLSSSVCLVVYRSISQCIRLPSCLSIYLRMKSSVYLAECPSTCASIHLGFDHIMAPHLCICLPIHPSVYLQLSRSTYPSICPSLYLFISPPITYLHIHQYVINLSIDLIPSHQI